MNAIVSKPASLVTVTDIENSSKNIDLLHISNFLEPKMGWWEFIAHSNHLEKNQDMTITSPVKVIGSLQVWDDFFVAGYNIQAYNLSQWDELVKKTEPLIGRKNTSGCTLINFIGGQKTIPIHIDRRDSFYYQAIGSVEWRIHESMDIGSKYVTVNVNPGDLLFVPQGISHTVYCPDPRAAVSVFYDK